MYCYVKCPVLWVVVDDHMAALSVADSSDSEPTRALSAPLSDEALKEKHCCRSCKSLSLHCSIV